MATIYNKTGTMIINIRGTHGSGKSTVVKTILDRYESDVESSNDKGKPNNYIVSIPWLKRKLYVIGSYVTACGGCDGIQPYTEIWPRIEKFAELGHVMLEGALVSSSYGNIGRASEIYGDDFVFAFMDTPIEVCIERIRQRRLSKGNDKPLNPANTIKKFEAVERSIRIITKDKCRNVVMIDHRRAVSQVLGILKNAEASEA